MTIVVLVKVDFLQRSPNLRQKSTSPKPKEASLERGKRGARFRGIALFIPDAHNPYVEALYRYPRGVGGFALMLLRIAVGILLLANGCDEILTKNPSVDSIVRVAVCLSLCLGLFTSLVGVVGAALSVWALYSGKTTLPLVEIAMLILSFAVAILGPGAYSADALLFGQRRAIF